MGRDLRMMKTVAKKTRPRGGASAPCPKCGGPTHVEVTRRREDAVVRNRVCVRKRCGHKFMTSEAEVRRLVR